MKTPLQYSPSAGTHIRYACQEAIALAGNRNRPVHFSFNGTRMKVHKRLPLQHVLRQWDERTEASRRRYRNSPKGKAAAEKRNTEILRKQRSLNTSLDVLADIIADQDKLMLWLKSFAQDADDIGVTFSKERLAAQLEAAGYAENEHVGEKPEWFNTRPRMAHYIVGQALNCLRIGMGPHPITGSFVDKYFALPKGDSSSPNAEVCQPEGGKKL